MSRLEHAGWQYNPREELREKHHREDGIYRRSPEVTTEYLEGYERLKASPLLSHHIDKPMFVMMANLIVESGGDCHKRFVDVIAHHYRMTVKQVLAWEKKLGEKHGA